MHSGPVGGEWLDVSSPRLFSILLLKSHTDLNALLINPDMHDLAITEEKISAFGVHRRCRTFNGFIHEAGPCCERFNLVSSISVIEHIPVPDDLTALSEIWRRLRPGGRLYLSVPCAAVSFEEYLDFNEYGILKSDEGGFVFGQRFYDEELLASRVFTITGQPVRASVYGEKRAGVSVEDRARKVRGDIYPFWRESYMMGMQFRRFERVRDLPGLGVIAMEFVKKVEPCEQCVD
jgi:SAM-dependent methyltransferase